MKTLGKTIFFFGALWLVLFAALKITAVERRAIFFPPKEMSPVPARYLSLMEHKKAATPLGALSYWLYEGDENKPVIIFSHGNGECINTTERYIDIFTAQNNSAVFYDYSGYCESEGRITEENIYKNLEYIIQETKKHFNVDNGGIILAAQSLGGAPVIEEASKNNYRAVIIISTFTSIKAMRDFYAKQFKVFYITKLFPLSFKFDSLQKVKQISSPIYLFHAEDDEVIPFFMGQQLADANRNIKFYSYEYGDHNGTWWFKKDLNNLLLQLNKNAKT